MVKRILFYWKTCLLVMIGLSGLAIAAHANPQPQSVTGVVKDSKGDPLVGVSVVQKGTIRGVVTDVNGVFNINVELGSTLKFSSVGYSNVELSAENNMTVVMQDGEDIDEVVVMGYYTQNRRDISSSVAKIDMKALQGNPSTSITSMLSGQAPGLQTVVRSGVPGAGGGGIVIRGNTSLSSANGVEGLSNPLYIVDGVPISLQDLAGYDVSNNDYLSTLNPDDIQSIDILKDASATAIYGSRGANGVIIINTKRGTSGKPRLSGRISFGVVPIPSKMQVYIGEAERQGKLSLIEQTLTNLYGEEAWVDVRNGYEVMGYLLPSVLTDKYNPAFNNAYDYQKLFYQTGFMQDYSLSMDGGTEAGSYRIGLGYRNEKGSVSGYGLSRLTFNASLNTDINKVVKNELLFKYSFVDRKGGLGDYMKGLPTNPTQLPSSLFYRTPEEIQRLSGQLNDAHNTNNSNNVVMGEKVRINILKNLSWDNGFTANMFFNSNEYYIPSYVRDDNKTYGKSQTSNSYSLTGNSVLNYQLDIKDHQITALAGLELINEKQGYTLLQGEDGSSNYLQVIQGYQKENISGMSDKVVTNYFSYFGRIGYGFKDNRYYGEFVLRRDASSRFGKNKKWATFPSVKVHWAFSKEPWLQAISNWLNFGKIRISYGVTGAIADDPLLQYNSLNATNNIGAGINNIYGNKMDVKTYGGGIVVVPDFNKVSNKDLSWTSSQEINYGIDLEMFQNRLFINADLYSKYISGLVYDSALPPYLGYNSLKSNLVDMLVSGFEFGLTGYLFPRSSDFQWEWTVNFAKNESMIAKLGNGGRDYISNDYAFVVGRAAFQYYMAEYAGTLNSFDDLPVNPITGEALKYKSADAGLGRNLQGRIFPGMPLFTDVNGDFQIDGYEGGDDRKIIENKSPEPKIMGGLHTTLRYKGFSLRIQSSFAFGHYIFNTTLQEQLSKFDNTTAFYSDALYKLDENKFWRQPGDGSYYPMIYVAYSDGGSSRQFRRSSMFLEKGDYWNIDNVTLSYTLPEKLVSKLRMRNVNISVGVQDLFMWKKSGVLDPRRVSKLGYYNGEGYPISRNFTFGLQFQF